MSESVAGSVPWVFYRDEVDLLEEKIEDLFKRHGKRVKKEHDMEEPILREQLTIEEVSDAEFALALGVNFVDIRSEELDSDTHQIRDVKEYMRLRQNQHPTYKKTLSWSTDLFDLLKKAYEDQAIRSPDSFRAYLNVNMIPIKVFVGSSEERIGDELGLKVAKKEYELALVYLERTLESLGNILPFLDEKARVMHRDGKRIQSEVQSLLDALNNRVLFSGKSSYGK